MSTLADCVTIERRFARSARLDADLMGTPPLVGYVLQGSIQKALGAMATAHAETRQGAFTWTGPYGGGKSSAALLVGNLVGGKSAGRKIARGLAGKELSSLYEKAFPERSSKRWAVVAVTGSRVEMNDAIIEASEAVLGWGRAVVTRARKSGAQLAEALVESAKKNAGVLLIVDELGKFLEHAVANQGDIHVLQDLAEFSARSDGRFVVVGILHQSFDQYAGRLSREARQEWAKVQGRFQDISFLAGVDETVALLGRAIQSKHRPKQFTTLAKSVAQAVSARRPTDVAGLTDALTATWPLNPVTALMLGPVSRQRFAQNERSVFGFLSSAEPHGFVEFLKEQSAKSAASYDPDRLWDYLAANFSMALASGPDGARFSIAFEAIDRASAKGGPLHVAIAKCAAVIEFFRNGSGVAVATEFLEASLPHESADKVRRAIDDLVDWAVLLRQPRLGGFAIFAGSDFELDGALDKARTLPTADDLAALPDRAGLPFAVAKRHYFRTGALRAFDVVLWPLGADDGPDALAARIAARKLRGSGLMLLLLADASTDHAQLHSRARTVAKALHARGVMAAVGAAPASNRLRDTAVEIFALEKVAKEHPQLQGDRIARREIAARRSAYLDAVQREMRESLNDANWWLGPTGERVQETLSIVATALADSAFPQTPLLKSELVQRERPSSNAMAALRELGHAMVAGEKQENLGLSGFPAEMGLYLTILQRFGLHRQTTAGHWGFSPPDDSDAGRSLRPAWDVLSANSECTLEEIYTRWCKPPFGLKRGAMPILAMAHILADRERLAVYVDGVFQTQITDVFFDRLLQNPGSVQLRRINRSVHEAGFLVGLARGLDIEDEPTALIVAQALFQRFRSLSPYSQRTQNLSAPARAVRAVVLKSSDPEALLFRDLPELKLAGDPSVAVMDALSEAEGAYGLLLTQLTQTMSRVLGVDGTTFGGLAERANTVMGLSNDLRFDAFAMRVASFERREGDIEGLVSMLVHKPPTGWSDRDRDQAFLELARFGRRFREAEALAVVRSRRSQTEALALVVGLDPAIPPLVTSFELTDNEKKQAGKLAQDVLKALDMKGHDNTVRLAALARAVASLAADTEANSEAA